MHRGPRASRNSHSGFTSIVALLLLLGAQHARAGNQVWTGVSPRAKSIEAIVADPLNPLRGWAASFGSGVYLTLDAGATWTANRAGLTNTFVRCLAVNPKHPDSLYCGTNDGLFGSADGGVSWRLVKSSNASVRAVAIHPVRTGTIYFGVYGDGVYKTTDKGAHWAHLTQGIGSPNVRDIVLHPARPETVFVATGTGGGVRRSYTGGLPWTAVPDTAATNGAAEQIQFDRVHPDTMYVAELDRGVIRTFDGGNTWARINRGLTTFRTRSLAVVDTLRYVGTDGAGVFSTTLNAPDSSWHPVNAGLSSLVIDALFVSPSTPNACLAGTDGGGLFYTNDRGGLWTQIDGGLLSTLSFSLAVRPSSHAVYDGSGFGDQFWKSGDQGATWSRATSLTSHDSEHGIAVDPVLPARVYLAAYGAGVMRSDDDGATWTNPLVDLSLTNLFVRDLLAYPGRSGNLFVGTGIGPFESLDGGATWISRVGNLPASFSARALALAPGFPPTLYAGSDTAGSSQGNAGVFRSADGGLTWTRKSAGLPTSIIHALLLDAIDETTLYAGTDAGVYKSVNSGELWTRSSAGLPAGDVRALAQDAAHTIAIFCGVYGGGVFESQDGGATWQAVFGQSGLSNLNVRALAVDGALNTLYAGTENGVAALSNYPLPSVGVGSGAEAATAFSVWPNPARGDGATVSFALARAGSVRVEIFSLGGERVRELVRAEHGPGRYSLRWDGRDARGHALATGIYFLRLDSPDGPRSIRLALLPR
jgi:photosystem II stability/assembly factor-like uncharacterized protein